MQGRSSNAGRVFISQVSFDTLYYLIYVSILVVFFKETIKVGSGRNKLVKLIID